MLPDRVSNPGPLTYESGALPIALRGPACGHGNFQSIKGVVIMWWITHWDTNPGYIVRTLTSPSVNRGSDSI